MGKICKNCGADNGEDEQRCLACKAWLPSLTERVLRKTKGPKFSSSGRRPGLRNYDENVISWPERTDDGEAVWTGERREIGGFPEQFVVDFLAEYYTGRSGLNKKGLKTRTKNKIAEYQCIKCSEFFPRKGQSDGVNWISIDHRVPICEHVVMKAPLKFQLVDDHSWSFYLLEDCKTAHLDPANLDPMCQTCNSSIGGNKDLDKEMRVHSGACRNKICKKTRSDRGNPY